MAATCAEGQSYHGTLRCHEQNSHTAQPSDEVAEKTRCPLMPHLRNVDYEDVCQDFVGMKVCIPSHQLTWRCTDVESRKGLFALPC